MRSERAATELHRLAHPRFQPGLGTRIRSRRETWFNLIGVMVLSAVIIFSIWICWAGVGRDGPPTEAIDATNAATGLSPVILASSRQGPHHHGLARLRIQAAPSRRGPYSGSSNRPPGERLKRQLPRGSTRPDRRARYPRCASRAPRRSPDWPPGDASPIGRIWRATRQLQGEGRLGHARGANLAERLERQSGIFGFTSDPAEVPRSR